MSKLRELVQDGTISLNQLYAEYEHNVDTFRAFVDLQDRIQEIDPEWWENHMIEFFEDEFSLQELKDIFGEDLFEDEEDDEELEESVSIKSLNKGVKKIIKELYGTEEQDKVYTIDEIAKKLRSFIEGTDILSSVEEYEEGVDIFVNLTNENWNEELYNEFYGWLGKYEIKGDGYEIYFSFDGSGYDYWINREGFAPTIMMVVETKGLTEKQFDDLLDDIQKASMDYDHKETYYWQQGQKLEKPMEESYRYATEQDMYDGTVSEDDYLESFEYIYSQLLNGNISIYKKMLRRLQKEHELLNYENYCREMGVDPEISRWLQ